MSNYDTQILEARNRASDALDEMERLNDTIKASRNATSSELDRLDRDFDAAERDHNAACRRVALLEAQRDLPVDPVDDTPTRSDNTRGNVRVTREPLTYEQHAPRSFFRDLHAAKAGDGSAQQNLTRHAAEMAAEKRTNPNQTANTGGEFIPPLWLQDRWAELARAGRAVADTLTTMPLPAGTNQINLPKVSTGATVAVQSDAGSVSSTDITTTSVTGQVQTIAGQQDVSQQLLDMSVPGIDVVIFDDLSRAYATQLDTKVINGTTTNAKGLLQLSNTNSTTYTDASPTVAELYSKLASAINDVHTNRFLPPTVIAMHPRRWAWFLAATDTTGRPLVVPNGPAFNQAGTFSRVASEALVGTLQGLPVVVDPSIPTTNGAGTNEDVIAIYRAEDIYLYESGTPKLRVFEEVLSGTLQVRFQAYGYYSIIAGRQPKAISICSGTGLASPAF